MELLLICLLTAGLNLVHGLMGPNVCTERQNYTITSRVKYQQPVHVKTYTWCLSIPPRCSSVHTEMREKWKVQTEYRSKLLQFCCAGYEENEERCVPKCPDGYTGENCDEDCPSDRWGPSCFMDCRCPRNSVCDTKNGKCICNDGWMGPSCDKEIYTRRPIQSGSTRPLFDWSTPNEKQTTSIKTVTTSTDGLSVIALETTSVKTTTTTKTTTTAKTTTAKTTTTKTTTEATTPKYVSTTGATTTPDTTTGLPTTIRIAKAPSTIKFDATTIRSVITRQPTRNDVTTASAPIKYVPITRLGNVTVTAPKTEVTSQIESPVTTLKPGNATVKDSPITVILNRGPKPAVKEIKNAPKVTESSIISLTVLKSTAVTGRKAITKQTKPRGDLLNVTLEAKPSENSIIRLMTTKKYDAKSTTPLPKGYRTKAPVTVPTFFNESVTKITTEQQTEEIRHVLTEPEQITSVAGDEDDEENRDEIYSALSIALGIAGALILVATIIVLVARYRRGVGVNAKIMEMNQIHSMMNNGEDELPSSYLRSVYHSPLPEYPMSSSFMRDDKSRCSVPFMQPVVIHAVSPIMLENFRDILESHYDHPKAPRPASLSITPTSQRKCVTFGTLPSTFCPKYKINGDLPVTEEAIDALKSEHQSKVAEDEEPVYDEIPWPPVPSRDDEVMQMKDEAVTEL